MSDGSEMVELHWEVVTSFRAILPREEVERRLGHSVEELSRRPLIDEPLYPDEPDMDDSHYELAEALGELETGPGEVELRTITYVEPNGS
jgi:hypothetical protein